MDSTHPSMQHSLFYHHIPKHDYPHGTHDLSAASQHLLSRTAFSPHHSISPAAKMRANNAPVSAYYADPRPVPLSLFNSEARVVHPLDVDFNRVGILLESPDAYLVLAHLISATETSGIKFEWLSKWRLGTYQVFEWESLPKKIFARSMIAVTGQMDGLWNVHSAHVMELRGYVGKLLVHLGDYLTLIRNKMLETGAKLPTNEVVMEQVRWDVQRRLADRLEKMLRVEKEEKKKQEEEMKSAMEEFIVFDED